jgi:hypothetical protein
MHVAMLLDIDEQLSKDHLIDEQFDEQSHD